MNICTWNVRGLNEPRKAVEIRRFLNKQSINVVSLIETRVRIGNKEKVQKRFGVQWTWFCTYSHSPKGRIWIGWQPADVDLQILSSSDQFVHCWVVTRDHKFESFFTAVYGLHTEIELMEILKGSDDPRVWSRIDRVFGNMKWMDSFPDISTKYMNPSLSDHSPIVIPCVKSDLHGVRPFRFLNYLVDHTSFEGIVTDSWNITDRGNLMEQIWWKLARVKSKLKTLHKEEFAHAAEKIEHYRGELDSLQTQLRVSSSPQMLAAEIDLVCKLKKWLGIEEQALKQKSRVQWLKVGDSNHHYFYAAMKER
ncbi:uncharacterized protein [Spinacia oleracea]|uniref:Endonuclease/exonuclease/phosphatase domain-containing protein n=1 Tax=Spinacia oleracea TaxID=3562 RepID=A0A9R0IKI6_SPIOL|nr:uncharacterized protein LOC110789828 [Spinacia oleracea]